MNDVERILYRWTVGQNVRADCDIHFGHKPDFMVPACTIGVIEETRPLGCTGLLRVRWPIAYEGAPSHTIDVAATSLEPCPS